MKKLSMLLVAGSLSVSATTVLSKEDHSHHHHGHTGHHHGGDPIGLSGTHIHEKGELMLTYKYMNMKMDGLKDGDSSVSSQSQLIVNGGSYMVVPDQMNMEMHMLGAMYGVTDDITAMVMLPYHFKSMDHTTNAGGKFTTESEGFGDVRLSATYRLAEKEKHTWLLNAGLSIPTGSIDERDATPAGGAQTKLPYAMQLGSGTFDLLPGVTYLYQSGGKWNIGAQAIATIRLSENSNSYTLGDELKVNAWAGYALHEGGTVTARLQGLARSDIDGADPDLTATMVPTADPDNYGVNRLEAFLGYGYQFGANRVSLEGGLPLYERYDGINMETEYMLTLGYQITF